jgi:hypothetical protein
VAEFDHSVGVRGGTSEPLAVFSVSGLTSRKKRLLSLMVAPVKGLEPSGVKLVPRRFEAYDHQRAI